MIQETAKILTGLNGNGNEIIPEFEVVEQMREVFFHQADVYASMWCSRKSGKHGFFPVCQHGKRWECGKQDLIDSEGGKCGSNCNNFLPRPITDDEIGFHLLGEVTLGAYLLADDSTCTAGMLDIDIVKGADLEANWTALQKTTQGLYQAAQELGLSIYLEDSGSRGYHPWYFSSEPLPAWQMQALGNLIASRVELPANIHLEIFPKQTQKKEDGPGSAVKVPLGIHLKTGRRCRFLDPETFEPYPNRQQVKILMEVEKNTPEQVREILERYSLEEEPSQAAIGSKQGGTASLGNTFSVDDPVTAILENCQRARDLTESSHLEHSERRFLAKIAKVIGKEDWFISNVFSHLKGFDQAYTERQIASLKSNGPRCLSDPEKDPTACKEFCEKIRSAGGKSPVAFAFRCALLTEYGNARRLKNALQDQIAYSPGFGWMLYNPELGIWEREPGTERIRKIVTQTLHQLLEAELKEKEKKLGKLEIELKGIEASGEVNPLIGPSPELEEKFKRYNELDEHVKSLSKWIKTCENHNKIAGTLKFAEGLFWVKPSVWDSHPDILVCGNGILNLETLELSPFSPSLHATKRTPVPWKANATHPIWDRVLRLLKQEGDRYKKIRRLCGSLPHAGNPNEYVAIFEGEGGTGKGTLITALHFALGDYAQSVDVTTLLELDHRKQQKGGPRVDLFALRGARFIFSGEPPKGAKLDANAVKGMSGNDPIKCRNLYQSDWIEFYPIYKIWIHTNFPIKVDWDDDGMKRRLIVVPFTVKPERPDPAIKTALMTDPEVQAAVLAWLIKEHQKWRESGFDLGRSETVETKTTQYWRKNNPFTGFAEECLMFTSDGRCGRQEMRNAYIQWCDKSGERLMSSQDFNDWLRKQPRVEDKHGKRGCFWLGVELKE